MKSLEKRANNVKNVDPSQDKGIDHAVSGANTKGKALALDSFHEMIRNAEYSYSGKGDHGNVGGRVDWDYFVSVARIGKTDIPIVFAIRTIDTDSRSRIYSIATVIHLTVKVSPFIFTEFSVSSVSIFPKGDFFS